MAKKFMKKIFGVDLTYQKLKFSIMLFVSSEYGIFPNEYIKTVESVVIV